MHLLRTVLGLLTGSVVMAQSSTNPPCIKDCLSKNALASQCDGDETGIDLDQCTCASYLGGATPMFTCIKTCTAADQSIFAAKLPALCRGELLPGVTAAASSTTPSATGGTQTPTTTAAPDAAGELTNPGLAAAVGLLAAALFL